MASRLCRRAPAVVFAICISSVLFTQSQSRLLAQSSADETALRALVERYFAAYAREDLIAATEVWAGQSPDHAAARGRLEKFFSINEKIEVRGLQLRRLVVEAGRASAMVTVEVSAIDTKTGKPATGLGMQNRSFQFVNEAGVWKIWREESSEAEFAGKLVTAKNEEERRALLDAHKELLTEQLGDELSKQGRSFSDRGNHPAALIAYQLALTVAERVGDKRGVIVALGGKANLQLARGDYPAALDLFQQALILAEASGEAAITANLQNSLCAVHQRLGNYDKASENCQRSLAFAEASGNKAAAAQTLNNLGVMARQRGNHEQALDFYRKSLALFEVLEDKRGMARVLNNLGVVYNAMGNATAALQHYSRSLPIAEEIGSKAGIAGTLTNISMIYRALGNHKLALEYSQRSLALSEAIGDKGVVSAALEEIGKLHAETGEHAQALEAYLKSLALAEQTADKLEIAIRLVSVGNGYRNLGNDSQAIDYYTRGLALAESVNAPYTSIGSLIQLGQLHLQQDKNAEALEFAERAIARARPLGAYKEFWRALQISGMAFRALKQPEQARQRFEEAISVIEIARRQLAAGEREEAFFFGTRLDPYIQMLMLSAEQGRASEAFSFAERAKARVLQDVLQTGRVDIHKAMSEKEREQEFVLRAELNSLNGQLRRQSQTSAGDQRRVEELKGKQEKARLAYENFQSQLYAAHPELRIKRGEVQPLVLEQAGELLANGHTALLEYAVAGERSFLFVLTAPQKGLQTPVLKLYDLKIKREYLVDKVQKLNQRIANNDIEFSAASRELYDVLLAPARSQLRGIARLIIVPDDILWETPFQALRSADGRFLIQDAAISYAPSLTVLGEIFKSRKPKAAATLLAMGNPKLADRTISRSKNVLMSTSLEPLPEAERLVRGLAQLYGAKSSKVYVGADAREEVLKAESNNYRIVHLATHGVLSNASPMYSHVVLSQTEGSGEDGLLEAWEMMNLDLHTDLVVLSACETARGRIGAGEGVIGMTWALFVAGSPTSVVSQWKVESSSTTELMLEFHKNLKSGAGKSEAMKKAAMKLIGDRRYQHPFYWAGFIVVGDGS